MATRSKKAAAVVEATAPVAPAPTQANPVDWDTIFQYDENEITLEGRTSGLPKQDKTAAGSLVAKVQLANHQDRKLDDGTILKHTNWFLLMAYGPVAETMIKYIGSKSRRIRVKGILHSFPVVEDGKQRTVTLVKVLRISFLDNNRPEQPGQVNDQISADAVFPESEEPIPF